MAQVTCEVQQPKATRPNEGLLFLNLELSPMGAPHFEPGRQSELGVQLNRLLEKCIKDSRCVDLESLCITAEEKVWALRVDINVLNHEGNLVDAASIAALTALCHFRRPDVTMAGELIVVHDPSERDPIPITLHHHPVCVTYAIFNKGEQVVADPTGIEERVSESQIVFGMNAYRELCGLHLGGSALSTSDIVLITASRAANRAAEVVETMKEALQEDSAARAEGKPIGFAEHTSNGKILALVHDRLSLQLDTYRIRRDADTLVTERRNAAVLCLKKHRSMSQSPENLMEEDAANVVSICKGSAELIPKEESNTTIDKKWNIKEEEEESEEDMSDIEIVKEVSFEDRLKEVVNIELSGDSEEEETVELRADVVSMDSKKKERTWYPMQKW
ncbi:hypothetical protein L9F63_002985 [Diploptera punctata]|uniref:Exosome complex component RRP45 n=1 Tax=Diploptera punctata TaxID=6984 RepID=A0AAD8ECY4_DIPPU|nr:hypothetical protein L9F63_002985 [Diploptera punctata]